MSCSTEWHKDATSPKELYDQVRVTVGELGNTVLQLLCPSLASIVTPSGSITTSGGVQTVGCGAV